MSSSRVIVVGGGLAGLSAAHTVLERGGTVTVLDKKPSFGGNSVKASSGINGADTPAQRALDIKDSVKDFIADTTTSAGDLARPQLIETLTSNSASAIEWLSNSFSVDLSLVSRLGGHAIPRTHRGKGGAPGWAMTSALIKKLEKAAAETPQKATLVKGAKVVGLVREGERVTGVEYQVGEKTERVAGTVILSTGGYAADFSSTGFLSSYRPDLLELPTTNGDHSTGDGHRLATSVSASLIDMDQVQVHPTGFIDPANPDAKTKFLAAEALRGVGGLLVDGKGRRFVNEVERRDFVTEKMQEVITAGDGPVRLILNEESYQELKAHCDFYISKGLMKPFANVAELAQTTGLSGAQLRETFTSHGEYASGKQPDPFGKQHFRNSTYDTETPIYVALMTPVVHYTMGGISISPTAEVLDASGKPIAGLFAAGEVIGGVHGKNRLGGSSLLEAVVFGRVAGESASK